jgi:ribulose-phosphate 3-epimerase
MKGPELRASVSLWSADARSVDSALSRIGWGFDSFHIDVVGHPAGPAPLLGPELIRALRSRTAMPIQAHLLVPDPGAWIDACAEAGASMIVLPWRPGDIRPLLDRVRSAGAKPALSLDPDAQLDAAMEHFDLIDTVIVMGCARQVHGVKLHPCVPDRIMTLVDARRLNNEVPCEPAIFVEGAVRLDTVDTLAAAGADGVIIGELLLEAADPISVIERIAALATAAPPSFPAQPFAEGET